MSLVKPNILAEALELTTDALSKRRYCVSNSSKLNLGPAAYPLI